MIGTRTQNRIARRIPLVRALLALRRRRSMGAVALYAATSFVSVVLLLLAILPPVQRSFMRRFHLVTLSYGVWALHQPVPSMYNFDNRMVLLEAPVRPEDQSRRVNHFPPQLVTNPWNRDIYYWTGLVGWPAGHTLLEVRSVYRGLELVTRYQLKGDPETRVIRMEIVRDE